MSKQMLIYEKAVPVSSQTHRDWSVRTGDDYAFASATNAVPLTAVEFPVAAMEYAIVFSGTGEAVMPVVIMGVRNEENLYLAPNGEWKAKYIPAFVRRYPFVFSSSDDGKNFTLCIDEDFAGCNQDNRGERMFDADGHQTQYLQTILEFLKQYQAHFERSQQFCKKLSELGLLEPMHAQVAMGDGEKINLAGFMAVSREKLKALSDAQLAELAKTDELELVYLHLQSMRNFSAVGERVRDAQSAVQDTADDAQKAPVPVVPKRKKLAGAVADGKKK